MKPTTLNAALETAVRRVVEASTDVGRRVALKALQSIVRRQLTPVRRREIDAMALSFGQLDWERLKAAALGPASTEELRVELTRFGTGLDYDETPRFEASERDATRVRQLVRAKATSLTVVAFIALRVGVRGAPIDAPTAAQLQRMKDRLRKARQRVASSRKA